MFLVMEVKLQNNRFDYGDSTHKSEIVAEAELSILAAMPYAISEALSAAASEMIRKLEAELNAVPTTDKE